MKKKRKEEQKERFEREKLEVLAAREALKIEEERVIKKKHDEKLRLEKIAVENEVNRLQRLKEKEERAKEDARLMKEYKEKLDREEAARAKAFNERLERLELQAKIFSEEGAGKKQAEIDRALELKILEDAKKKEEEIAATEKAKAEKRRLDGLMLHKEYKDVIEQRQKMEADLKANDLKLAKSTLKEVANSIKKDKEKQLMKKEEALVYQDDLRKQIIADNQKKQDALKPMSSTEFKLNKEFVTSLKGDATLLAKVKDIVQKGDMEIKF